jgi:hypothetical protein
MSSEAAAQRMDEARAVADTVLYEGYLLYPYRASAEKNQARWQFGVLVPPSYAAAGHGEHAHARTECLLDPGSDPVCHIRVRFLQLQRRSLVDEAGTPVDALGDGSVGDLVPWDEAVEREVDVVLHANELVGRPRTVPITFEAGSETEQVDGGAIVRQRWPSAAELRCEAESLPGPYGALRLRTVLANTSDWDGSGASRSQALRYSLIAAHSVAALTDGRFISLLDSPEWAKGYVAGCLNEHTWPVLLGAPGDTDTILSSPIILYDHPEIAPESPGDFFDSLEMDELLALRTMALTDGEKREARATDERSREIIDRVDGLPPELVERLHGAVRSLRPTLHSPRSDADEPAGPLPAEEITARPDVPWWDPDADDSVSPETDSVVVAGRHVAKGSSVILRPGQRRADAQDMFLAGMRATVQAVVLDVDDRYHLAVAVDEDPAAELQLAHGRFRYFSPDEVEPVAGEATG